MAIGTDPEGLQSRCAKSFFHMAAARLIAMLTKVASGGKEILRLYAVFNGKTEAERVVLGCCGA